MPYLEGIKDTELKVNNLFYIGHIRPEYAHFNLPSGITRFDEVYNEATALAFNAFLNNHITLEDVETIMVAAAYFELGQAFRGVVTPEGDAPTSLDYLKEAVNTELPLVKNMVGENRKKKRIFKLIQACKEIDLNTASEPERIMYDAYHSYFMTPARRMYIEVFEAMNLITQDDWKKSEEADSVVVFVSDLTLKILNDGIDPQNPEYKMFKVSLSAQMLHPAVEQRIPRIEYSIEQVTPIVRQILGITEPEKTDVPEEDAVEEVTGDVVE